MKGRSSIYLQLYYSVHLMGLKTAIVLDSHINNLLGYIFTVSPINIK